MWVGKCVDGRDLQESYCTSHTRDFGLLVYISAGNKYQVTHANMTGFINRVFTLNLFEALGELYETNE